MNNSVFSAPLRKALIPSLRSALTDPSAGPPPATRGPELVPGGAFDNPALWTPQDGNWTVTGGKANYGAANLSYLQSVADIPLVAGVYEATLEISGSAEVPQAVFIGLFNKDASAALVGSYLEYASNGVKTVQFTVASSTNGVRIYGNPGSVAPWSLESFSIKAVL